MSTVLKDNRSVTRSGDGWPHQATPGLLARLQHPTRGGRHRATIFTKAHNRASRLLLERGTR